MTYNTNMYVNIVSEELLDKAGFVVKAGWPMAESPDVTIRTPISPRLASMRKLP